MTPGMRTFSCGSLACSKSCHSWAWRGLAASKEMAFGRAAGRVPHRCGSFDPRPRSWRRPPQQLISQVEEPKSLRKWGFWDSLCHSEWPKVADAVIKARSAQPSATIASFRTHLRRHGHGLGAVFLRTRRLGSGMALPHTLLAMADCLWRPIPTTPARRAFTTPACQCAQTLHGPDAKAPLCPV